jgi:hypothetical protein
VQPSEDEFRAFVGPNADYYLRAWAAAKPDVESQRLRWNWPAFFLNIVWLLYRRMYRYFWIGFGVLAGIGIVQGAAEELLHFKTPSYVNFGITLSIANYFGSYGTGFYYRHALDTIRRARVQQTAPDEIAHAGGARLPLALAVGVVRALVEIVVKFGPGFS